MPISFVQSTTKESLTVSSDTLAFASAVASTSLIVVAARLSDSAITISSITDSLGSTYSEVTKQNQGTDGFLRHHLWYTPTTTSSGANTLTINLSAATNLRWAIHEYSGLTTAPLDAFTSTEGVSANPLTTSVNTASTNELLFATACASGSDGYTVGTGYTGRAGVPGVVGSTSNKMETEDQIVSTTGTFTASYTLSSGDNWAIILATFKAPTVTTASLSSWGGLTLVGAGT